MQNVSRFKVTKAQKEFFKPNLCLICKTDLNRLMPESPCFFPCFLASFFWFVDMLFLLWLCKLISILDEELDCFTRRMASLFLFSGVPTKKCGNCQYLADLSYLTRICAYREK